MFSFKQQLRTGDLGEIIFAEAHKDSLIRLDGFKSDFEFKSTGEKLELKTDLYSMDSTPNFFFERFSSVEKGTPGGPWQALENGSSHFVYLYLRNLTYYTFPTLDLVTALDNLLPHLTPTEVKNKSWTTLGYRVARELVAPLARLVKLTASVAAVSE